MSTEKLSTTRLVERSSDLHDLRNEIISLVRAVEQGKSTDRALRALRKRILATTA